MPHTGCAGTMAVSFGALCWMTQGIQQAKILLAGLWSAASYANIRRSLQRGTPPHSILCRKQSGDRWGGAPVSDSPRFLADSIILERKQANVAMSALKFSVV
jgi:hypothetical protein